MFAVAVILLLMISLIGLSYPFWRGERGYGLIGEDALEGLDGKIRARCRDRRTNAF